MFQELARVAPTAENIRNLGVCLFRMDKRLESLEHFDQANAMEPQNAPGRYNLGVARASCGDLLGAIEEYRAALAIDPRYAMAHSNLIFTLDCLGDDDAAQEARQAFNQIHGRVTRLGHINQKRPDRRLRVGYVSGDYQHHSAAFVFKPVLEHHDRDRFEVFCYSATAKLDQATDWFRNEFRWRQIVKTMTPDAVAAGIRNDGIDILVDLSGHSRDNQLLTFALKPAPIQITGWGYALGSGLTAMDYFVCDPVALLPARRHRYPEAILDMPCLVTYEPMPHAPGIAPTFARTATFGAFARLEKMTPATFDLWASVLRAMPGARFILKSSDCEFTFQRERLTTELTSRGVHPLQLDLRGRTSHVENMRQMMDVDVMLDTFPHGGGVTCIEALWMGVPVVTLAGELIQSRLATSILTAVGLTDTITTSPDEYVAEACRLMKATEEREAFKGMSRARIMASPLGQHDAYTRQVEAHYLECWKRWCATA